MLLSARMTEVEYKGYSREDEVWVDEGYSSTVWELIIIVVLDVGAGLVGQ